MFARARAAARFPWLAVLLLCPARGQETAFMAAGDAGAALVRLVVARAAGGTPANAYLYVDADTPFRSFSIRDGENGAALLTRAGLLELGDPFAVLAIEKLLNSPSDLYLWLDENSYGALRTVEAARFETELLPQNQTPPNFLTKASAPAGLAVYLLPGETGGRRASAVLFEAVARFPGPVAISGLHLHEGEAGVIGPAVLAASLNPSRVLISTTGLAGHREVKFSLDPAVALRLEAMLANPGGYYLDLHTAAIPTGAMRGQLAPAAAAPPALLTVLPAGNDPALTTLAQGGLMSIYGRNLSNATVDGRSFPGGSAPLSLNGVAVAVGNYPAPVLWVSADLILAQTPFEVPPGVHPVKVTSGTGESRSFDVRVAAAAPVLFLDSAGALCLRNSDYSRITSDNPGRQGEVVFCYANGLGQTTPPLQTGVPAPGDPFASVTGVTLNVGGISVTPVYAIAVPGSVGTYQVAFRLPQVSGAVPLTLTVRGATSNRVPVHVR
jgi:uncharacterized protein (TIGR03437 family)